ncbi:MAG: PEP-CTERM sorting domain-containing protein [Myxococcales bacterium]|nr:PEP-CTERM sorting domain-containing protein [Myxococcales bacterium]
MGGLGIQLMAGARTASRLNKEEFEMRKLLSIVTAGAILFALAGTAQARVIGWTGTLSVQFGTLSPISVTTPFAKTAILNGSAGLGHLTTLQFPTGPAIQTVGVANGGGARVILTDPELAPLVSIQGTFGLGTGVMRPISGGAASAGPLTLNQMPVAGVFKVCILFQSTACPSFIPVPLTVNGTQGVGLGGTVTVNTFGKSGIKISGINQPWTIKTAAITAIPTANGNAFTTSSRFGFAHGPASATSSTANVSGVVQLVAPTRVVTTISGTTALFSILRIHFIPEPGTFLLFGAGVVALGVAGRRRVKKN